MATFPGANTLQTLNGLFKELYSDDIIDLIPDGMRILKNVPFDRQHLLGGFYNQPVTLNLEHGVTFAGSDEDAFTLVDAVPGGLQNAQVKGTQLLLRSVMGIASIFRSEDAPKAAFKNATKYLVANMLKSVMKKLEIELMYGQVGYGTVASVSGLVITIPDAEWAPGIWGGAEKMPIEIRDATGATSRGVANITAVSFDNKTITVDVLPPGTVATDVIWHKGAFGKEFAGVHKIITNTGTLFNISAAAYTLFKGNVYSAGSAPLSMAKIQLAVAKAVEKGLDSDVMVLVNPNVWSTLLNEQAALRDYDHSYSPERMENGAKSLKFHGQNGVIEVVSSIYVKQGYAYVLYLEDMSRIGSTDITFKRPGKNEEFFKDLDSAAGVELRAYTDQALFCASPGKNVLINNITLS